MLKFAMVGTAALFAIMALGASTPAMAFGVMTAVEDNVNGWVGPIPTSSPAIMVGSDGESPFDPFGAGYDTSDEILLNADWAPDPAYAAAFAPGYWTQVPGTFLWVLPACNNTGCENANIFEPVAKWDFTPGSGWNPGTLSIWLTDPDGSFSDFIRVANDGPGGAATITFNSGAVPEPSTWAMMLLGFGGLGALLRGKRRRAVTA